MKNDDDVDVDNGDGDDRVVAVRVDDDTYEVAPDGVAVAVGVHKADVDPAT